MRKLFLIILLAMSFNAIAFDECLSGSFFDPTRDGEGLNIEPVGEKGLLAYFYTFANFDRIWYTMLGDTTLTMYTTVVLDDVDFITKTVAVGAAEIEFLNNNAMYFSYQILLDYDERSGEFEVCTRDYCAGSHLYKRLTQPISCK